MGNSEHDDGGDDLAPVIPLFGARHATPPRDVSPVRFAPDESGIESATAAVVGPTRGRSRGGDSASDSRAHDEPRFASDSPDDAPVWGSTWAEHAPARAEAADRAGESFDDGDTSEKSPASSRRRAATPEAVLLRKLRTRALSLSEARAALRVAGADPEESEALIDDFVRRGYLDDQALAEQLVTAGSERKGQGRRAIALALAKRGIARDIADRAIEGLPDDDAERALEFARTKARQLDRVDEETAFRRLSGQLARRGYSGSSASAAARTALAERRERPGQSVRFR